MAREKLYEHFLGRQHGSDLTLFIISIYHIDEVKIAQIG